MKTNPTTRTIISILLSVVILAVLVYFIRHFESHNSLPAQEPTHVDENSKSQPAVTSSSVSVEDTKVVVGVSWENFVKPDDAVLRSELTPEEYEVTQQNGTETPFQNAYWNNHADGIYVDIVSGEPLFSSLDKYDSGTGWPSFTKPLVPENVVEKDDTSLLLEDRTEVRSKHADSHLGHVFNDGPAPTGLRYCMNSAALRFIPKDKLAEEGYGQFATLFSSK